MNQSFRVIFQAATGTFVAVSELTKSNSKTKSSRALRRAAVAGVLVFGAGIASAASTTAPLCVNPDVNNPDVCLDNVITTPVAPGINTFSVAPLALGDNFLGGSSTSTGQNGTGHSYKKPS